MNKHQAIAYLFDHFYYKIYRDGSFKLNLGLNKQSTTVDNFLNLIMRHYGLNEVGFNFLLQYFLYAFSYWKDKNTQRRIALNWIIGPKMFQKYLERNEHSVYFVNKFTKEYDINETQLLQELNKDNDSEESGIHACEEAEKLRFDGEARLYHCINTTTLYNHKSKACMLCSQKSDCKKILKDRNPKLFEKRGYK